MILQKLEYDIANRKKEEKYRLSDLQKSILLYVCTNKNSDYHSLCKATARKRTTIIQSLQPLRNRHYIDAYKKDPENDRSSLIFKPTHKDINYTLAYLDTEYDEILNVYTDAANISEYNKRISEVEDYQLRKNLMHFFAKMVLEDNYFNNEGKIKSTEPEDIINLGFRIGLSELIKDKNFDFRELFNPKSIQFLTKIYTKEELEVIRAVLTKIRNNLDSCIKQLHD